VPRRASSRRKLERSGDDIGIVVEDKDAVRGLPEAPEDRNRGFSGIIHKSSGFREYEGSALRVSEKFCVVPVGRGTLFFLELCGERAESGDPHVVIRIAVFGSGISEPYDDMPRFGAFFEHST